MRRQLIEALTYPKLLVRGLIEDGNFPHQNLFEATGERCNHCDLTGNCGWENCLQDFRNFDEESTEDLSVVACARASGWSKRCTASYDTTRRPAPARPAAGLETPNT